MATISGGDKLEAALAKIAQSLKSGAVLKVGFLEGSTYPDGTSVALVASVQEFGAPSKGIPPRPFFRNMIAQHSDEWGSELAARLKASDYDVDASLKLMGEEISGQLEQSITEGDFTPLKPATIRRKGFDRPLVDTGHMKNSIAYEVSDTE